MGFLGIEFLRNEQNRKNALIKIEDEVKKLKEEEGNEEVQQNGRNTKARMKKNQNHKEAKSIKGAKIDVNESKSKEIDPSKKFRRSAGKEVSS